MPIHLKLGIASRRQMDELGNGRTNPVCFRDFDRPQTEFPEKSDNSMEKYF